MHVVFWILSFIKKAYLSDFNLYAKMKRRENNILKRQLLRPWPWPDASFFTLFHQAYFSFIAFFKLVKRKKFGFTALTFIQIVSYVFKILVISKADSQSAMMIEITASGWPPLHDDDPYTMK
jgi:hypothetical protein